MADSVDTASGEVTGGQATVTDTVQTSEKDSSRKQTKAAPKVKPIVADVTLSWVNVQRAILNGTASQGLKYVQEALRENSAYTGKLDGRFGPESKKAVQKMARAHGVDEQGVFELLGFTVV